MTSTTDILTVIEQEINPVLKLHNGSCELVSFEAGLVTIRLHGGCVGCPSSKLTLFNGIMPILQERFPDVRDVELAF